MPGRDETQFRAFAGARAGALRRTAFLLCGDWHEAEDLVQAALVKLYVAWPRVHSGTAEAYARQVLTRAFIDSRRRRSSSERPTEELPDRSAPAADLDGRLDLLDALDALAPGQRAVIVLRYWEDLPVADVAELLRIRPGTVKSQATRGLESLRKLLGTHYVGGTG